MPPSEPEPEILFEAPSVPEPAPIKAPKPMSLFEPKLEEQPEKPKHIFTPPPKPPQGEKFKPKSVPFTSSTPIPASPPEDFQALGGIKPSDVNPPANAPFVLSEEPDIIKPLKFTSPAEKDSGAIPFSVKSQSKVSQKNSIVDYTESLPTKKDRKKSDKKKKKEEKEKIKKEKYKEKEVAKLEKERKLLEAKEKQEKLIEDMKKVKSDKKLSSELIKSVEPLPFGQFQTTNSKKMPSESTSLFQTLVKKTEEPTESTGASFVPFATEKKRESEVSTELRIIPNVEDFESKEPSIKPSRSTLDFQAEENQPKKRDLIICKQCGAILSSDYTFCNKCGYRL
jgi:ribosomal protein L40E